MSQRLVRTLIAKQNVFAVAATMHVAEAARLMKSSKVGAAMVVDDDGRLIGMFTERDALFRVLAEGRNPKTTRLADVLTATPKTIHPDKPFAHALHMMYEGGFRHVPVVDHGKPVGMVSARDALGLERAEFANDLDRREWIGEILG